MSNTNQNTDGLMLLVEAVNLIEAQDEGDREASSLKTEDTGLTLEKAVCLALGINYNGKFKYSESEASQLAERLEALKTDYSGYSHTARGGAPYDFSPEVTGELPHLSCKSNKTGQKVAPHSLGQAQPLEFCQRLGLDFTDIPSLKSLLQTPEVISQKVLPELERHTFDADIIYYHKRDQTLQLIRQKEAINWEGLVYSWTRKASEWNNSSTLKANKVSILEIQFHEKNRTNMAVRWNFKNILKTFPKCFHIRAL